MGHLAFFCEIQSVCGFLHRRCGLMTMPGLAVFNLRQAMRGVVRFLSVVLVFPACKRLRVRFILRCPPEVVSLLLAFKAHSTRTSARARWEGQTDCPVPQASSSSFCPNSTHQKSLPHKHPHFFLPFPTSSVTVWPSAYPKFFISSGAIKPLSMRQFRYPLLSSLHSGELTPRAVFRHRKYCFIIGWHSASWSRGKEPRAGGLGRPILTPVPGAPKVDISFAELVLVALFGIAGSRLVG
jgi:hypothetical protein